MFDSFNGAEIKQGTRRARATIAAGNIGSLEFSASGDGLLTTFFLVFSGHLIYVRSTQITMRIHCVF